MAPCATFRIHDTSLLVGVLGISAAVFAFIVPGLSDKFGRKPVMIIFTFIGIFYPLAALYYQGSSWMLAALVFLGWSASGTFPLFMATIPSETIPSRYVATTLGLVMGLGELIGGGLVTVACGAHGEITSTTSPSRCGIASGLGVIATVLTLFLVETAPVKVAARKTVPGRRGQYRRGVTRWSGPDGPDLLDQAFTRAAGAALVQGNSVAPAARWRAELPAVAARHCGRAAPRLL